MLVYLLTFRLLNYNLNVRLSKRSNLAHALTSLRQISLIKIVPVKTFKTASLLQTFLCFTITATAMQQSTEADSATAVYPKMFRFSNSNQVARPKLRNKIVHALMSQLVRATTLTAAAQIHKTALVLLVWDSKILTASALTQQIRTRTAIAVYHSKFNLLNSNLNVLLLNKNKDVNA